MAKNKISEYSSTSANNTDISNINIAEGCSPANVNNAIRTVMAQIKDLQAGTSGDTIPLTAGGTGSTTAATARTALSAAASGANSDITSLTACTSITGLTTPLTTAQGGTGTASTTFANLATNVTGTLPVANGGTGATTLTSGSVIIGAGTSTPTFVAPTTTGNVLFTTNGTTWSSTNKIARETQITLSGTSQSFSSIPAWVKKVTFMMSEAYTSGSSNFLIQLGTSGGVVTTGYSSNSLSTISTQTSATSTAGLAIINKAASITNPESAIVDILNMTGNTWISTHVGRCENTNTFTGNGFIALSAALTSITFTTVNGTDTLTGSINIMYE